MTYVTGTVDYVTEGRNASGLTVRPTVTVDRDGPGHSVRKEVDACIANCRLYCLGRFDLHLPEDETVIF